MLRLAVFSWIWLCAPTDLPEFDVSGRGEATTNKTDTYTKALAEAECADDLDALCQDRGQERDPRYRVYYGSNVCTWEPGALKFERWWTCRVTCSAWCRNRPADDGEQ